MKSLVNVLHSLGLTESEVQTYRAAFEHGASTVIDLAKNAKLSRQATYQAIELLTKRGLMTSVVYGKKRLYSAEHPRQLLRFAKQQEEQLHEKVKDLEHSVGELELQMGGEKPVVKVYEGKEGIRAIIEDMRQTRPKETEEIADLDAMYKILTPEDLLPMRKEMRKLGTFAHGLYVGEPTQKISESERYVLPASFGGFKSNITIYGDKVALVTFSGKMHSVIIQSPHIVQALKVLFSFAYETAKKKFPKK